jgi:hypothetical protein
MKFIAGTFEVRLRSRRCAPIRRVVAFFVSLQFIALFFASSALADDILVYDSTCSNSYVKIANGKMSDFKCTVSELMLLDNGRFVFFVGPKGRVVGFAGDRRRPVIKQGIRFVPVDRFYRLTHKKPTVTEPANGLCFFPREPDVRDMQTASCMATVLAGKRRYTYEVHVRFTSKGESVKR